MILGKSFVYNMHFKTHHVAFTVPSIEETVAWYEKVFDAMVIHSYQGKDMDIVLIGFGEIKIELFQFRESKPMPEYSKSLMDDLHVEGIKHLSIQIEDLKETMDALRKRGVTFVTEIDTAAFGGHYVFFKDCNGTLIELYQS
jgi:catechol 2,3-dioxygenase-like lactoylglutathione lyase family enzyme